MTTRRKAKGHRYLPVREIEPRPKPKRPGPHVTPEQREFIVEKLRAGLNDREVSRMFFRQFGEDLHYGGVRYYRSQL